MTRSPLSQLFGSAAVVVGLLFLVGCEKKGTTGGPGVSGTSTSTSLGSSTTTTVANSAATFNLTAPSTSTTIKQGDSKTVTIGIKRGRDFDQAVPLTFTATPPTGVTIDPPAPMIKSGDKEVTIAVVTAPDTAPGDFTITVVGHPGTGEDSTTDFKVTVEKK